MVQAISSQASLPVSTATQEKLMKEGIGQGSLEREKPSGEETDPEDSQKRQKTLTMGEEQQNIVLTVTKVLEALVIGGSEKLPSSESEIANPTIDKATCTPSSEEDKAVLPVSEKLSGSESKITLIDKAPESQNSKSEHTPYLEGKKSSESEGEEKEKS